ncbi:RNA polymerase [Aneurinibacillus migulanus]|uniref:RNA polymerase sigma factor n=1 Tax=Aneurinibacillus migulanus TaxID=47500 RepID=UPI0005B81044|nr:sigma-70 family RNA polymerase sigma factor [Aneurinibacillus migulanus]KIV56791.1 RNA polymerase [Aneurinibacillus migulanus]KPD05944.1 RNA polymerase [Aneurinibacillus migulanus]CEH28954.1 RNA polymerase, sigma-24 subunit, ECF subfamily [Aneurinibacillus migulanus]
MQNKTDEQLIHLVGNHSRSALEELYDRYVRLIYSFALKSINDEQAAREIVQMVFTRLWTTGAVYDSSKGKFLSWLLTITRNIILDYTRKKKRESQIICMEEHEWHNIPGDDRHSTEAIVFRKLIKHQVQEVYQRLSENQIQLIQQLYWEGYSLSEIARMRDEPLGTIKSRLHQTLKILRKHLLAEGEG